MWLCLARLIVASSAWPFIGNIIGYVCTFFAQIRFIFLELTMNSLFSGRIHNFSREFFINSLSCLQNLHEFIFFFVNSLWIHSFFANSLWIHHFSSKFTIKLLFFSRIHYLLREYTIFFLNQLWIHYFFVSSL